MVDNMIYKYFSFIFILLAVFSFVSAQYGVETYPSTYYPNQCQTLSLTPSQVQALWNNFLYPAAKPDTIYSGDALKDTAAADKAAEEKAKADAKKNQEECVEVNELMDDGKTGMKVNIGCESNPIKEDITTNESCIGDYAFAVVLDKTLRLARCQGLDENVCAVNLPALSYSNAMTGFKLVTETFSDVLPWTDKISADFTTKTEDDYDADFLQTVTALKAEIDVSLFDFNQVANLEAEVTKRVSGAVIPNHIKANNFEAHFEDVCAGANASNRCKVYVFSFFDRHYNALYSTTMLASMFTPAIVGLKKAATSKGFGAPKFWTKARTVAYKTKVDDLYAQLEREGFIAKVGKKNFDALEKALREGKIVDAQEVLKSKEFVEHLVGAKNIGNQKLFAEYIAAKSAYGKSVSLRLKDLSDADALRVIKDEALFSTKSGFDPIKAYTSEAYAYHKYALGEPGKIQGITAGASKDFFKSIDDIPKLSKNFHVVEGYSELDTTISRARVKDFVDDFIKKNPDNAIAVQIDGAYVNIIKDNADDVLKRIPEGIDDIKLFRSGFEKVPEADAKKIIAGIQKDYIKKTTASVENLGKTDELVTFLTNQKMITPKYANLMHYALSHQFDNRILDSPLFGNFIRYNVAPALYWRMRTSDSPLKAYFIGERELTRIKIYTGKSQIYNDAYVDFFVNDSLSNGDFFEASVMKIMESVGFALTPEEHEQKLVDILGTRPRDSVQNVVYYSGTDKCADCTISRFGKGSSLFIGGLSKLGTKNYLIETPDLRTYNDPTKGGLTLAAFTHHTNIDFYMGNEEQKDATIKETYDLEKAIQDNETCTQKVENTLFGSFPGLGTYFKNNAGRLGLPIGIIDSTVSYLPAVFLPTLPALIAGLGISALINEGVRRQFDGCVDAEDGYYIQYNHRFYKEDTKQDTLSSLVSKGKSELADLKSPLEATNKVNASMDKIKSSILDLTNKKEKEFLQIKFYTYNETLPKIEAKGLFMVWIGPRSSCSPIDAEKMSAIGAKVTIDGKESLVVLDPKDGTLKVNGNTVIQNELLKFNHRNNIFGGFEIPNRLTFMPATIGQDYFQFLPNGEFRILNSNTSSCALQGAYEQTGLNYYDIMQYTGRVIEFHGDSSSGVFKAMPTGYNIEYLGGSLERTSLNSSVVVDQSIRTIDSSNRDLGRFTSAVFEKAHIWYREKEKDFVFWVRVMKSMNGSDIQRFFATPTKVTNPDTGCEELALDLSVIGNQLDAQAKIDGEEFDTALKKSGPYQYFETDKKIIMFYSKLEDTGECQDYMKVIDKATNKVILDTPINSVEQIENGVKVNTADGSYTLEFSNENGKPILSFNGDKGTLLLAQGREGSFYFDPSTKQWYVGNSQMLPFNDKFASEGILSAGDGISKAGGNPLGTSTEAYGKKGVFDLPLFEGFEKYLFVLLSLIFAVGFIYFRRY